MEFAHLSVLALFCLALMGTDASQSAEDYWQSVWPNTPLPKPLWDLLLPYSGNNLPIKAEDEKQYWTVFFEHDLHPSKKISLGFDKPSNNQPSGVARQPLGGWIWREKDRYTVLEFCQSPATLGEEKYCGTSLESMMDFAISKLGKNIKAISSSFVQNQDQYIVQEVKKIGEKAVMCHRLNLKNVVFYCHVINATTSYIVPLVASDGTKAEALAMCHHDTRGMDPVVLKEVLKVKPGTVTVCHFMGNKSFIWVPILPVTESDHPCVI
ncbi:unknown seed protein USP-like [Gastrolobium bilobum]|uniref:unknown seed protein USP-like n=1 Tax=Gastrolobium bilobum TaxID=150636 RepID=UPI002AAFD1D5|nr:unknown seed protein USP-like [Gastrolobium bilobum]